jgi:NADH-quinone oxidoreductase subunit J
MTALLALGAAGLFLALPGGRPRATRLGQLCLAAAGVALFELALRWLSPQAGARFFAGCALVALFAAVRVITHQRPVYSALYFVLLIIAVAALLVQTQAEFLAAALVIIYAGAILVTYIFVIMLAQQDRPATYDTRARAPLWGALAALLLLWTIAGGLFSGPRAAEPVARAAPMAGTLAAVGTPLLTTYLLAIQLIGLLLLAALVGAIAIARRRPARDSALERDDGC